MSDDIASEDGTRLGQCHCGAVRFRVQLVGALENPRRCNCSMCRMRGAVVGSARLADFELLAGDSELRKYEFNTGTAKHYFCSVCGIYTHHQRRSNPELFRINVACLEGVSPFDFDEVVVLDGENHPRDTGRGAHARELGVLRYERRSSATQT